MLLRIIALLFVLHHLTLFAQTELSQKVSVLCEVDRYADGDKILSECKELIADLEKYSALPPEKKVKKIFKSIKKKFLVTYDEAAFFPDIFKFKKFNCVTGTTLIALVFDELNIPYNIVEVPRHIYMVAYPNKESIGIESTSEKRGVYPWTSSTKMQAVYFLLETNTIKEVDVKIKGVDGVLDDYYFNNSTLNFNGLISVHFYNKALVLSGQKRYSEALKFIDRGKSYYEGPNHQLVEGSILSHLISEAEYENIDLIYYLTRYYRIIENHARKDQVRSFYRLIFYEAFNSRRDLEFTDSAKVIIPAILEEDNNGNEILSLVYLEESVWHARRGKTMDALNAAITGYALNNENLEFEDIISRTILLTLDEEMSFEELNAFFSSKITEFPFLMENDYFLYAYIEIYAYAASEAFYFGDIEDAWAFKSQIDPYLEDESINQDQISEALADLYGNMANYYYREEEYNEALKFVDLALSYKPDSEYLQGKKDFIQAKR